MFFLSYNPAFIGVSPVQSPYPLGPLKPMRTPLFSNNAMVFYKPGSTGSPTVGGITNRRHIAKRI